MADTQLVRITLIEGDPDGLRTASLAGRTTNVTGIPWVRQKELFARPEAQRPGVYVLIGEPLGDANSQHDEVAYIGECDSLAARFSGKHHQADRAEWGQLFFATTTDGTFNKAHARLAEDILVQRARAANRAELLNGSTSIGRLDEGDIAVARDFSGNVQILIQTLGISLFRQITKSSRVSLVSQIFGNASLSKVNPDIMQPTVGGQFTYRVREAVARMAPSGSEFIVLADSTVMKHESGSIGQASKRLRQHALQNGSLVLDTNPELLRLTKPMAAKSVSMAACAVSGNSVNGMLSWISDTTGQSYADWSNALGNTLIDEIA